MRRRDLIQSLAGAAIIWPAYVARAQQGSKLPKIGYLSDEGATPHLFHSQNSILKGLRERGYEDGRNIVIEYRYAAGKAEQLASLAAELVALPVDVILAVGSIFICDAVFVKIDSCRGNGIFHIGAVWEFTGALEDICPTMYFCHCLQQELDNFWRPMGLSPAMY